MNSDTAPVCADMDIESVWQVAVAAVAESDQASEWEIVMRAASAMPADASDFDRGLAAGIALARLIQMKRGSGSETSAR